MNDEPILLEQRGAIAVLTLNRPDTRNALSGEAMFAAFETHFARLNDDLSTRAAVLTGAGSAFCSRGDIAEMRERSGMFTGTPRPSGNYRRGIQRIPRAFQILQVPIIAAVNARQSVRGTISPAGATSVSPRATLALPRVL